jgi:hypothetical protein
VGISLTGDIQLRLLSADTKESLDSQSDSHLLPGNIFLILDFLFSGQSGSREWIVQNATLTCGTDEYKVELWGLDVGDDGRVKAWRLIFEVPQDSDYRQCVFNLKEYAVELGTLFK